MQKKKICFIIESMEGGGTQKNLFKLINTLKKENVEISLITFKKKSTERFILGKFVKRYYAKVPLHSVNTFSAIYNNFIRIKTLRGLLRKIQPFLILSFLPSTNILTLISSIYLKKRVIISERNDPEKQNINFFWNFLRFIFYRYAYKIICNSENAAKYLKKIKGTTEVVYIKNFINQINTKKKLNKNKFILAVGRLEEQKNFENLIRGFDLFNKHFKNYCLYILGEGSLREKLTCIIKELKLENKVFLPGYLDPHPYYNSADLYISSSNYEGVSNATIEAMHYGLPIISTINQNGINYLLENNKNSLLIDNSIDEIFKSIFTIINNKKLSKKLGNNARKKIKIQNDTNIENSWKKIILN